MRELLRMKQSKRTKKHSKGVWTPVTEGMTAGLGLDLKGLLAGFLGGKASQLGNIDNVTPEVKPTDVVTEEDFKEEE